MNETFCEKEEKKILTEEKKYKHKKDNGIRLRENKIFFMSLSLLLLVLAITSAQSNERIGIIRCEDGAGTYWTCSNCGYSSNKCYEMRCSNCGEY